MKKSAALNLFNTCECINNNVSVFSVIKHRVYDLFIFTFLEYQYSLYPVQWALFLQVCRFISVCNISFKCIFHYSQCKPKRRACMCFDSKTHSLQLEYISSLRFEKKNVFQVDKSIYWFQRFRCCLVVGVVLEVGYLAQVGLACKLRLQKTKASIINTISNKHKRCTLKLFFCV